MNPITIIAIMIVLVFVPLSAYADDFKIEKSCKSGIMTLAISDLYGKPVPNTTVLTITQLTGMRGFEQKFIANELGIVEIQYANNTGIIWLQKGGFNDQKYDIGGCSLNEVPAWIKTNAKWWLDGKITEDTFVEGIQFLAKNKILKIPEFSIYSANMETYAVESTGKRIPDWVTTNVEWWLDGTINDDGFLQGLQYLIINGVIDISEKQFTDNYAVDKNLPSIETLKKFEIDNAHNFKIAISSDTICKNKAGLQAERGLLATDFDNSGIAISASICKFDKKSNTDRGITGDSDDPFFENSPFVGIAGSMECFMDISIDDHMEHGACRDETHLIEVDVLDIRNSASNIWSAETISGLMDDMLKNINKMKGTLHVPFNEIVSYHPNLEPVNQVYSNSITHKNSSNDSFEINIISCDPTSGGSYIEINYGIKNNLSEDYTLDIQVLLLDVVGNIVEVDRTYADTKAGRTIYDDHMMPYNSRTFQCAIEIVDAYP